MRIKKTIILLIFFLSLNSCADYSIRDNSKKSERQYYEAGGFALVFDEDLYKQKIITTKINNENLVVVHKSLKKNTLIKITNPLNSKSIETKIFKKADFPKIFTVLVSKEVFLALELDIDNPYIELEEIKKNKTFVAKKTKTFDEEKKVAETVPVDEISVDDLSAIKTENKNILVKKINDNKYRLYAGPFKNFNALKTTYISLNKLGFENLNIKRE